MSNGKGCMCAARSGADCACPDVDWTPKEVYELREKVKGLEEKCAGNNVVIKELQNKLDAVNGEPHADRCAQSKRLKALLEASREREGVMRDLLVGASGMLKILDRKGNHESVSDWLAKYQALSTDEGKEKS